MDKNSEKFQSSAEQDTPTQDWSTVESNNNQLFNHQSEEDITEETHSDPAAEAPSDTTDQISDNAAAFVGNIETPNEYATINAEIYQTVMPGLLKTLNVGRENQVPPEIINRVEDTCDIFMNTYFDNKNDNIDLISALESRKAAYEAAAQAYRDDLDDEQAASRNLELAEYTDELIERATSAKQRIEYKNDPNSTYAQNKAAFISDDAPEKPEDPKETKTSEEPTPSTNEQQFL